MKMEMEGRGIGGLGFFTSRLQGEPLGCRIFYAGNLQRKEIIASVNEEMMQGMTLV